MRAFCKPLAAALLICPVFGVFSGCGSQATETADLAAPDRQPATDSTATPPGGSPSSPLAPLPNDDPREIVRKYLEAVKLGDAENTTVMLTELARERAEELNIDVTPPGSDTARIEVGRMEYVTEEQDVAHVESRWTEYDVTGEEHSLQSVWVLALEEPGWRIAGVVVKLFGDGELPLVLNYEDPEEVVRKLELAREEMLRRVQQEEATGRVLQAQQQDPATGFGPQ